MEKNVVRKLYEAKVLHDVCVFFVAKVLKMRTRSEHTGTYMSNRYVSSSMTQKRRENDKFMIEFMKGQTISLLKG